MPDLSAETFAMLKQKRYRYAQFSKEGVLQAAKHNGDTAIKKEWEDIEPTGDTVFMRLPKLQPLDLDSV